MLLPEAKPNSKANATRRPFEEEEEDEEEDEDVAAGSQSAKVVRAQRDTIRIMVLKRPILSARSPGAHRPKNDPAFKIESNWYAKLGSIPAARAKEVK